MEMTTTKKQELQRKADVLKQYEVYGYQIAYYLLENEQLAAQAATQALLELLQDEQFFIQPQTHQIQITKQVFMKQSLLTKMSKMK
ncbi:hypothetical protein [Paenibacillus harenae]|uniref:Uncharacterized protein n=1 Tax=Paenibacillus harenae TaxID=306543 RepID=A0ABT9U3J6_PAEHA|nr:hypothetical protein [Paenibacillus harenae]MDQ0058748.1 hypothetical protein [Paenibacillus harenae]MDQ0114216.1 hypothetical protein [Paenibacillus harenae]